VLTQLTDESTPNMTARANQIVYSLLLTMVAVLNCATAEEPARISFSKQIRPILNKHCTACHGGVKQAADVSFVYRDQVVAPEGWIVEPGEPDDSELVARIISDDPDDRMPPPKHGHGLTEDEVDLVKRWIEEGADWGEHWAYEKPIKPVIPQNDSGWCRNEIDQFILQKLKLESIEPSKDARPERWLRRVTLDLI
jgi:mono/diheme cytochrome c family protein